MLDRQGITRELQQSIFNRKIDVINAIGTLKAFSLIEIEKDGSTCTMHRLVQRATQRWLHLDGRIHVWHEKAMCAVANIFPCGEYETWSTCQSLLPHALLVVQYSITVTVLERLAGLQDRKGRFDGSPGRYSLAESGIGCGLRLRRQLLGDKHPDTLTSMSNLASPYRNQGRWKEAEEVGVQAMDMRKRVLGDEHPDTLTSMSNLASPYRNQGRWKEAEELGVQAMDMRKRALGEEHPHTLRSMTMLVLTHRD